MFKHKKDACEGITDERILLDMTFDTTLSPDRRDSALRRIVSKEGLEAVVDRATHFDTSILRYAWTALGDSDSLVSAMRTYEYPCDWDSGYAVYEKLRDNPDTSEEQALTALYDMITRLFRGDDDRMQDYIERFLPRPIPEAFVKKHITDPGYLDYLRAFIPDDVIASALNLSQFDNDRKKLLMQQYRIVDGEHVASPCEIGKHDYQTVRKYWDEPSQTSDSVSHDYIERKIMKCKKCGHETERTTGRTM